MVDSAHLCGAKIKGGGSQSAQFMNRQNLEGKLHDSAEHGVFRSPRRENQLMM
jgi:hypothetical protein